MPIHTHVPRDLPGKATYRLRRVHKKQVCRVCGLVREYSMPVEGGGEWLYGEWRSPDRFEKDVLPIDDIAR